MDKQRHQKPSPHGDKDSKKGYSPPRILSREPLEAVAAACPEGARGKAQGSCSIPSS